MKTYVITGATSGIGKALVEKFVNGNINPEQQSTVYKMLTGFVDDSIKSTSNVYNEDKVFDAHEKFFDDFKKYNVLAYPQNLLDSYLLMNAKDSPVHSTDPICSISS